MVGTFLLYIYFGWRVHVYAVLRISGNGVTADVHEVCTFPVLDFLSFPFFSTESQVSVRCCTVLVTFYLCPGPAISSHKYRNNQMYL